MEERSIVMIGPKSPLNSAFAVFEHFADWVGLRATKVLPDKAYFTVVVLANKNKADIAPNLFVQGYRPHSSGKQVLVDKRRYGAFIPEGHPVHHHDDVVFQHSQLYQIKGERDVELILADGQVQNLGVADLLVKRICLERGYEQLGSVSKYVYSCHCSAGYFLANRTYVVWASMVGQNLDGQLIKKMLILDYYTGIPAVVEYQDELFESVNS